MSYRDSTPRRSSNEMGQFGGYRVYVGDIGQRMGRTDLEREFGQYGPVTDVWMGRKREPTAQNYAFVVFRYPEDADEAVRDRNGRKVCGRKVRVEHAKPVNSNPRRQRGGWSGGGGRGDYGVPRGGGGGPRRRSRSRERFSRRSRSQSPVMRNSRVQQSPVMNRRRNESFSDSSPKKVMRRSPSDSPEPKPQKTQRARKQMSPSPSPPPQSRSKQQVQDSDSGSLSPSPPPKKKKKKQRRSPSNSPQASDEYDARQYQKPQGGPDGSRSKPVKNKKKNNFVHNEDYSSDDY